MPLPSSSLPPFTEPPFIPQAIRDLPQWICWRASWDQAKGKWDKKPICVATGTGQGFTKIEMGAAYDDAVAATKRLNLAGVGFVFHAHNHIVGIDLDHCRDPKTGEIEPWAKAILDLAETYAEVSPSGTGVHLFAVGDLGGTSAIKNTPAQVEMYASGRYFTITGQHIAGTPKEVNPAPQTLEALQGRLLAFPVKPAGPTGAKTGKLAPAAPAVGSAEAFSQHAYRQTFFGKVNDLAMGALGKWVQELFPTASLEAGTGAWRVKSSDLGRGLEEDISIHPDGIVDFGVHDMGDEKEGKRSPIDLVIEWLPGDFSGEPGETSPAEAALWLCQKLGVDPRSLGFRGLGGFEGVDNYGDNPPGPGAEPKPLPDVVDWETAKAGRVRTIQPTIFPGLDRGLLTVIAGASGTLKSTYLMHAAVAIIAERPDIIGVKKLDYCGDVLVFANEDPEEIIDKRLDAIMARHGVTSRKHKLYVMAGQMFEKTTGRDGGKFVWKEDAEAKITAVALQVRGAGRELALVAIDTLASTAAGNDETNREMQEIAGLVDGLIRKVGSAGLFVHHWRKMGTGDKAETEPGLDAMRGGGAFGNTARNVVFVSRPNKKDRDQAGWTEEMGRDYVKLWIEKRSYGPTTQDDPAWFEKEKVAVPVIDPRKGSLHMEDYLVLIPQSFNKVQQRVGVLRAAWKKIGEANAAGREVVRMGKANKSVRSVQGLLEASDVDANKILDELVARGWVEVVEGEKNAGNDWKTPWNVVALKIEAEDSNI